MKNWSRRNRTAIALALFLTGLTSGQTLTITSDLPGTLNAHRVSCAHTVATRHYASSCASGGNCEYFTYETTPLPDILVANRLVPFAIRTFPIVAGNGPSTPAQWSTRTFTFADKYDWNNYPAPFLMVTDACVDQGEITLTLNDDFAWFHVTEAKDGGLSWDYLGKEKPVSTEWPVHADCSTDLTNLACKNFVPRVTADFNTLKLGGRIPGSVKGAYGYAVQAIVSGPAQYHYSALVKIDPHEFFTGSLPLSWFTDQEALALSSPRTPKGPLGLFEPFVVSTAEKVPIYMGAGMMMEDPVNGEIVPLSDGKKVNTQWSSGVDAWTAEELKAMPIRELLQLPLPWMDVALNQEDYFKPEWQGRDYKLHALSLGNSKPPIPPDKVINLNPPSYAECPDMFTYYRFYRNCADKLMSDDKQIEISGLISFFDQSAVDMDRADGQTDHTVYGADGTYMPRSQTGDPPSDRQYDIESTKRTNPENATYGDPFEATRFFLKKRVKAVCPFAGGCDDDCFLGVCDGGYFYFLAWWDDFDRLTKYTGWSETREVDKTATIKTYLASMEQLFRSTSQTRDLLGPDSPLKPGFRVNGAYPIGARRASGFSFPMGMTPSNWIQGPFEDGKKWFGLYHGDGAFGWIANISEEGYKIYKVFAESNSYKWKVFLGNPNRKGAPFSDYKQFVSEGFYDPLAIYKGDRRFSSFFADDDGFRWGIVQSYPILLEEENGERIPLGTLEVHAIVHEDIDQDKDWIGDNYDDNPTVGNNAPVAKHTDNDTYDKESSQYQTDAKDPEDRDDLTWAQKRHALWRITKMIAVSEGLDLGMHLLKKYRKELWYLAQKIGLEKAIRTTARYAVAAYRIYHGYRQAMDQARKVRDVARRLAGSKDLLEATSKNVWNYYKNFDWSNAHPRSITRLLPMNVLSQQDFALWAFMENISQIGRESAILSAMLESYYTSATGRDAGFVFNRREQEHVAQIAAHVSTEMDQADNEAVERARTDNPHLTEDKTQLWKFSNLLKASSQKVSGTGIWLENGYTRAAFVALNGIQSDWNTWAELRDRTQWQISNFGTIFTASQSETKVDGAVAARLKKAGNLFHTSTRFGDQKEWEHSFEANLSNASTSVMTCGSKSCFGN